jgi:hypothetical protein
VFAHVPWISFYHSCPGDYWRFSPDALRALFPREAAVRVGVAQGPASAIVSILAETFARGFTDGDKPWPYAALRSLALLCLFPLKYLDRFLVQTPGAYRVSGTLYAVASKLDSTGGSS